MDEGHGKSVTASPPAGREMRVEQGVDIKNETAATQENVLRLRGGANTFADCLA